MPRRTWRHVKKGQLYAVEWPEWHVDCAVEDCDESLLVCPLGEQGTARDAESVMKRKETEDDSSGWKKVKGLWYCPVHADA